MIAISSRKFMDREAEAGPPALAVRGNPFPLLAAISSGPQRQSLFLPSVSRRQRERLPAGIFAVVGFVKLRFNPLLPPELLACPPWVFLKVVVPLRKIAIYRCLGGVD